MGFKSVSSIVLVAFCLLAVDSSLIVRASDWAETAAERRWTKRTVTLSVSRSLSGQSSAIKFGSEVEAAAQSAAALWTDAAALDIRFRSSEGESVSAPRSGGDGISLVTVAATAENLALFPDNGNSPPAYTRLFFDRRGTITEADVVLNPYVQFSTDGTPGTFDLKNVLLHELGHVIGLGHSPSLSSVMFERIAPNDRFSGRSSVFTPSAADIAAAQGLYGPAKNENECCTSAFGSVATRAGGPTLVWAEEASTGRLAGLQQFDGGSYLIGGLRTGRYRFFAQSVGSGGAVDLGEYEADLPIRLKRAGPPAEPTAEVRLIGLNAELAAAPVTLAKGRNYQIFLGGSGLLASNVSFGFSSKHIYLVGGRALPVDYGSTVEAVMINISVDADAPDGEYSIYVANHSGAKRYLIGALSVGTPTGD